MFRYRIVWVSQAVRLGWWYRIWPVNLIPSKVRAFRLALLFIAEPVRVRLLTIRPHQSQIGFDTARAAETVSVLALQDWLNQSTTNKDAVTNSMDVYGTQKPMYPNSAGVGVRFRHMNFWVGRSLIVSLYSPGIRIRCIGDLQRIIVTVHILMTTRFSRSQ
jgi:hypothetical protein